MSFNPYEEPRDKSKGELEVNQGSLLLMLFRHLKVDMPLDSDAQAVERVGVLLARRFPWISRLGGAKK